MVINAEKTYIGYRCPSCGKGVISAVGIFSLGAAMLKLKCECGGSELTVALSADDKIRLVVPCLLCPKPHNFTLSRSVFFGKDLFILPCPYSDVNICFLGSYEKVSEALERTELELLDMIGEENLEKLSTSGSGDLLPDPEILNIVTFVIHDLEAEHKIFCNCPDGECDPEVEVTDDGVSVRCRKCGASALVPTDSLLGAHAFLNCDRLNLE